MIRCICYSAPVVLFLAVLGLAYAQDPPPKKYALLIGVNTYDKPGFTPLEFAEADALEMAKLLRDKGYIVRVLLGSARGEDEATRENINLALQKWLPQAKARDLLVVAFSGHGLEINGKHYFCPKDAVKGEAETLVAMANVIQTVEKHAGNRLLLVDACRDDPTRGARGIDGNKITLDRNTALMLSCSSGMRAYESRSKRHGAFFYFVLDALRGNNPKALNDQGDITWGRLRLAVEETFPAQFQIVMQDATLKQQPQITDGMDGTTVLIPRKAREPKPGEEREVLIAQGVKMKFCWIPPGKATLGSPKEEQGREPFGLSEKEHEFTSKGFWMGKFPVTQEQWTALMGTNPSFFVPTRSDINQAGITDTSRFPVERVAFAVICGKDWEGGDPLPGSFLAKLNAVEGFNRVLGPGKFRLPHEDQWEYACRGGLGNANPFYWGKSLNGDKANCNGSRYPYGTTTSGDYKVRTTQVGDYETKAPHPWGLCDMSGNVWNWCVNKYSNGSYVLRGGSWGFGPGDCRAAVRRSYKPGDSHFNIGFRVVLD